MRLTFLLCTLATVSLAPTSYSQSNPAPAAKPAAANATSKNPIKSLVIHSDVNNGRHIVIDFEGNDSVTKELDLGEEWQGTMQLIGPGKNDEFRIQMIFETSMTIMNEGPHLDLKEWKHFKSEPIAVWPENGKKPRKHHFTISGDRLTTHAFPFASKEELIAEVKRVTATDSDDRWVRLAETCTSPQSYPCGVSVSKVWIQIFPKSQIDGKPLVEAILLPPMGC